MNDCRVLHVFLLQQDRGTGGGYAGDQEEASDRDHDPAASTLDPTSGFVPESVQKKPTNRKGS